MRQCLLCSRQYEDEIQFCPHDGAALPPPDRLVGQLVDDKYRIEALHGSGGMGSVYRATQVALDRVVALKVVRGDYLTDPVVVERFEREALAVARLKHPHIVTVYDFGRLPEGGAYLVMEFLEGRTLREEIHARGRLAVASAVELMRQTCSAVAAAHAAGVIHRDLKPDNIFLERSPEGAVSVKILDFGVAKLRFETGEPPGGDLTLGGMMLGTPLYMSPEQCEGRPLDARSDVYSLGCVFYEMLAGRPPFTGDTATQLIVKHVSEAPEPLGRLAPHVPAALEAYVMRALEKDPARRPQTAAELGEAIAGVDVPVETVASAPVRAPETVVGGSSAGGAREAGGSTGGKIGGLAEQLFSGEERKRLAVLPFRNLARDESVDFLSLSLADAIITELSGDAGLTVRPTTAVEPYLNETVDQGEVSRALDVGLLLSGSFLRQGDAFQLNVQLVDVASNEIVWRHRSTESCDDLLALQDSIVATVSEGVRGAGGAAATPVPRQATPAAGAPAAGVPTDPVALDLYRQAAELGEAADERRRATELLERAVGLDPDLAPAWSALAARYYSAAAELGKGAEARERALRAAERALLLDRGQLGSVVALGRLLVESGGAEDVARSAVAVLQDRPDSGAARFSLGYACRFGGLLDRALREFRRAEQLESRHVAHEIAAIYLQKQLYTDAVRVVEEASEAVPHGPGLFVAALAWALVGDAAGAGDALAELESLDPESVYTAMARVLVGRLEGGETGPLLSLLAEAEAASPEVDCWLALVLAFTGDDAGAAARLERAVSGGYFNYPFFTADPHLSRVLGSPAAESTREAARLRHERFAAELDAGASGSLG